MSLLTEALSSTHLHGEALLKKGDGTMRGTLQVISTELRTPLTCWGWRRNGTWSDLQVGACWESHRYARLIRGGGPAGRCSCSDWAETVHDQKVTTAQPSQRGTTARPPPRNDRP